MAAFALIATISANTVTKRDNIYAKLETFLSGKPVWGNTEMSKGIDPDTGKPNMTLTVRFTQRPNLDKLFDLAKTEINKLTGVKITVSKHICRHDTDNRPCVVEEVWEMER